MFTVVVRCSAACLAINGFSQEDEEDRQTERKWGVEAEEWRGRKTKMAQHHLLRPQSSAGRLSDQLEAFCCSKRFRFWCSFKISWKRGGAEEEELG